MVMAPRRWRRGLGRLDGEEPGARALRALLRRGAWGAIPVALAAAAYAFGVWGLWGYARSMERVPVRTDPVLLDAEPPALLAPDELAAVLSAGRAGAGASLYDADLAPRIAASYEASPWVRRVLSVRRRFPDRVEVELALRRPFAYVQSGRFHVLVDADGVRLPRLPEAVPDRKLPVLVGARGAMPGFAEPWSDASVRDALAILARVDGRLEALPGARRIAVREARLEAGERPAVVFRTDAGIEILWGECDGRLRASLPTTQEKLDALASLLAGLGGADVAGACTLNLRFRPPCVGRRAVP